MKIGGGEMSEAEVIRDVCLELEPELAENPFHLNLAIELLLHDLHTWRFIDSDITIEAWADKMRENREDFGESK